MSTRVENHEEFAPGEWVREDGTEIVGRIAGRGEYPGEWRINLPGDGAVVCLGENLERWHGFAAQAETEFSVR